MAVGRIEYFVSWIFTTQKVNEFGNKNEKDRTRCSAAGEEEK